MHSVAFVQADVCERDRVGQPSPELTCGRVRLSGLGKGDLSFLSSTSESCLNFFNQFF